MRHSTEPKNRRHVKGYDFLTFERKSGNINMVKNYWILQQKQE